MSAGGKYIDDVRGLDGRGLMFYSTANNKTVTCTRIKLLTGTANLEVTGDDVNNLIMRMAVGSTHPALFHPMLGEKQFVIVGPDATYQTRLGFVFVSFSASYQREVSACLLQGIHLLFLQICVQLRSALNHVDTSRLELWNQQVNDEQCDQIC